MAWELSSDRPIYSQLVEILERQIVSGRYPAGGRMPSVRELAETAAVNPNTMQKALAELEREGLVLTQRTSGRMVTEDEALIQRAREGLAERQIRDFFVKMRELGFGTEQIEGLLDRALHGESGKEEV